MVDDWDLQAVVRGCSSATVSSTTTANFAGPFTNNHHSCFSGEQDGSSLSLLDPFITRNAIGELHDLCKPFFPRSYQSRNLYSNSTQAAPISSSSSCSFTVSKEQNQIKQKQQTKQSLAGSMANSHAPRSKRRKNQMKKICQVPAEALSSDVWAWRKYGQKPIKGSPYPRGYYRCSSSKGCLARKQVERNRSDPGMFIVTYTGEHNHPAPTHRNSLAGSIRQKSTTSNTATTSDSKSSQLSPAKSTCSSPATSMDDELLPQSRNTESRDEKDAMEDDEEEEFGGFSDMAVSDDFFAGLEELTAPATRDCFSDRFPVNFGLPWLASSTATAASGI